MAKYWAVVVEVVREYVVEVEAETAEAAVKVVEKMTVDDIEDDIRHVNTEVGVHEDPDEMKEGEEGILVVRAS